MQDIEPSLPQPPIEEETFTIPENHNMLVVKLKEHTWVSASVKDEEIISDKTSDPCVDFSLSPGTYTVRTDGKIEDITSETVEKAPSPLELFGKEPPALLRLTSDAPDQHVVDGIGEITADGTSFCTITIEKVTPDGKPLTEKEHKDELFLRTTGGFLMDSEKKERIRSLKLKSGRASFCLVSEDQPKIVTVSVLSKSLLLGKAEIQIEFI
jgi:hypothetical protein